MDEPMLRAWMQEPVPPAPDYAVRPGRWVGEPAWPQVDPPSSLCLTPAGLRSPGPPPVPGRRRGTLTHSSPLTVGLEAGAWCAYGNPADLPTDQRRDDALSLCFDAEPIERAARAPRAAGLQLTVSADRSRAFVFARLCDLAPTASRR